MSSRPSRPLPPTNGWMRLELRVQQGALHEVGQRPALAAETPPRRQRLEHLGHRRRDEGRRGQRGAGRAEPVLRGAKLARRASAADLAAQQLLVQLAHELQRERHLAPVVRPRSAAWRCSCAPRADGRAARSAGAAPTWSSSRSERLTCAPSMRDEQSASWRLNDASSSCGSGSSPPTPESSPSAASARDSASTSLAS